MEPRIRYAKTKDGVSIAYWVPGEGMAFVSHAPLMWATSNWNGRTLTELEGAAPR